MLWILAKLDNDGDASRRVVVWIMEATLAFEGLNWELV